MIYTVTFNPALDYIMRFSKIEQGSVNRSDGEDIFIGGKGINVSMILKELGQKSVAVGFTAGFTGTIIKEELSKQGIKSDFVKLEKGFTRINVKLKSEKETDLNARGPEISEKELNLFYEKLAVIKDGDILILAGSIPDTLPEDIYEKILSKLCDRKVKFVVDATGKLLMNVLKYKPFLIKPNHFELGEMFGVDIKDEMQIKYYAEKLQQLGAVNVLVSMAKDGAILLDENGEVHKIGIAQGKVVNSVGAGDSMVAGFVAGFLESGDYDYALKLGSAAGNATAFSEWLAQRNDIYELMKEF